MCTAGLLSGCSANTLNMSTSDTKSENSKEIKDKLESDTEINNSNDNSTQKDITSDLSEQQKENNSQEQPKVDYPLEQPKTNDLSEQQKENNSQEQPKINPLKEKLTRTEFRSNIIPEEGELYRDNYDLNFSLEFWNKKSISKRNYDEKTGGTGWLIDWKGNEDNPKSNEPFCVFLATNLHVADLLMNPNDYDAYKKDEKKQSFSTHYSTKHFFISKYLSKTEVEKLTNDKEIDELKKNDSEQGALVSFQSSKIPKTAYTAINFFSNDKNPIFNKNEDIYADFAVIELELFLEKPTDKRIFDLLIFPAIKTYKRLGDSLKLFEVVNINNIGNKTYYIAGYPYLGKAAHNLMFYESGDSLLTRQRILPTWTANIEIGEDKKGGSISNWRENLGWSLYGMPTIYHKKEYKRSWGHGLFLNNTNFAGGISGSAVFNNEQKISSIFYGSNEYFGASQILRAKTNNPLYSYDLIFGDQNTTKYYAQFAKTHNTHMYDKIKESQENSTNLLMKAQ